ncbi:MAG: ribonuclease III domain-containing protein, partial [Mariprofundales bacterium]|nr:ribonuclease III domain-containing protein [Mariprofundales bacterium]
MRCKRTDKLLSFSALLGYRFNDLNLLKQALTHRSVPHASHNERLEFLGDAVLDLVISAQLFQLYSGCTEGELTRMRSNLVERAGLLCTAQQWQMAPLLHVSRGERGGDGTPRASSVVANAVEAVIGAIYIDGGYEAAATVVLSAWGERIVGANKQPEVDAKTAL